MNRIRPAHLALATVVVALVVWLTAHPALGGPGLTWDEAFYYPTFLDVRAWVGNLFTSPGYALSPDSIAEGWGLINELPPVVKWLGALSLTFAPEAGWGRVAALRVVPAVAYALTLLFIFLIGRRLRGEVAGLLGVLLYLLLPRIFAHAQIAATETVFTAITMATAWVAIQDLHRWKWRVALIAMAALALATKVNGIILVFALLCWFLGYPFLDRSAFTKPGRSRYIHNLVLLAAALLLAPILAFAIWPWMWSNTLAHLHGYYLFVREHSHQGLWYFGKRWNFRSEFAPVTYPFVITHLVTPLWISVLLWIGLAGNAHRAIRALRIRKEIVLLALLVLGPFSAASLPTSPKYDGIRLFHPMFAPLIVLCSVGLSILTGRFLAARRRRFPPYIHLYAKGAIAGALALQAFLLRPTLSYYNWPTRFAARDEPVFPFEQTYWGDALRADVYTGLNEQLPPNARVKTLALQSDTFAILKDWGVLRSDIEFNGEPPYDAHLIQNRRGFWGNAEWLIYQNREPLAAWGRGSNEEPLVFLYDGRPPGQ